uniref:Uncharacterized protein n=1 Tax=Rhizophora mucronata TaxID=61149 RepID=A0A2P2PGH3_RHIMU
MCTSSTPLRLVSSLSRPTYKTQVTFNECS